jgi:hypothetical protein
MGVGVGGSSVLVADGVGVGGSEVSVGGKGVLVGEGVLVGSGVTLGIGVHVAEGRGVNVGRKVLIGAAISVGAPSPQPRQSVPTITSTSINALCFIVCHPLPEDKIDQPAAWHSNDQFLPSLMDSAVATQNRLPQLREPDCSDCTSTIL